MIHHSIALTGPLQVQALQHLLRDDRQEDLCFALWYPSQGRDRLSALLHELVLPEDGERHVHGNVSFEPEYFERALHRARRAGAGLALLHSHGGPGWQDMSRDDVSAESGHAASTFGATGLPLVGLTLGTDGAWSARFWERIGHRRYQRRWCHSVRVVGSALRVTYHEGLLPTPRFRPELTRTVSAWGPNAQAHLARLRVGIVGAGSVGTIVAEALARNGIANIRLLDFDGVENLNRDRQLHATPLAVALREAKVSALARGLQDSATAKGFHVEPLEWSVTEEDGFRAALDCDILFSCVDRPWPRHVLNFIAYTHLIPVVDGGILVDPMADGLGLRHADWRAHVAMPGRRCLECLGQYDAGLVSVERDGYLDDPTYIAGLPTNSVLRRNENVFAFSLSTASFEVLQFLALVIAPQGLSNPGAQMYHFVNASLDVDRRICNPGCLWEQQVGFGDHTTLRVTGRHHIAEEARKRRQKWQNTWHYRIGKRFGKLLGM